MNTTEMGIGVMTMTCVLPNYTASGLPTNISYTIRVGAAPGPDLSNEDLTLNTRADPVFITDGSALEDSEISTGEGGLLKIKVSVAVTAASHCPLTPPLSLQGSNLASVERSEIRVTVGGEECTDRGSAGDAVNTVSSLVNACSSELCLICLFSLSTCAHLLTCLLVALQRLKLWYEIVCL